MTKLAITLRRGEDMSVEEFREYYREEHAPLAADLPGLERYSVSFPADPESASYDALAELYFPDDETMAAAFDSELGREVTADAETFADMDAAERVVLDEEVVVD
ncbi:EthD family reductase [Halobaculum roseum]|uniref:EthD family reductase n=1 Tax=Halobaculum roseum TaxID=2175149 RepID=A0ABD5MJL5_9EURY|nr:EthD family reductase [Halobaculum roseum]QZY02293.1 EthD family reductase [Halobaculum roseum]